MTMTNPARVYTPFVESDAAAAATTLRDTMEEYGYLFFRALIPTGEVLKVRHDVLELCQEAGWLNPSSDMMDAIASPDKEPTMEGLDDYMKVYRKVLRLSSFFDFPTSLSMMQVAQKILDLPLDEVLVHPRRIGRITFPNLVTATTPSHQDHFYIRGTVDTYSCWTPLGDCPIQLGGLAVAPGSHQGGYIEHNVHTPGSVGSVGVEIDDEKTDWHTTDYGLGDALFFHSYTVHKALPNLTPDRLRISTDNRYQRPKEEISPSALLPHFAHLEEA